MSKISIESTVAIGNFDHLYLVFGNDLGEEFVIRGGPENNNPLNFGEIVTEVDVPIEDSLDARGTDTPTDRGSRDLDLGGRLAEDVWEVMKQQATNIHDAIIDYRALISAQNSNSTIASVLNSIGIAIASNVPTNTHITDLPGIGNLLKFNTTLDGTTADDIIWGYEGIDNLSSMEGDDNLKGGKGNDFLNGGTGFDTYIINPYDGSDTIIDEDGLGVIQFNNINVSGRGNVADDNNWIKINDFWVDRENNYYYQLLPQSDGTNDLVVTMVTRGNGTAQATVKVWRDGQLGISLGENTPPDTPAYDRTILGDLQPDDVDPDADGIQIGFDDLGNVIVGTEAAPDRADTLLGSIGNDLIQSFGGNDDVSGKDGADRIAGGAGQDKLEGGAGNDLMLEKVDIDTLTRALNEKQFYSSSIHSKKQSDEPFYAFIGEQFSLKIRECLKKLLFGIFFIFFINQNAFSENYDVNPAIDKDFIAWSNSMPKDKAADQLKDFLSSFDSWKEAKAWLVAKGFKVDGPLLLETDILNKAYGITQSPLFSAGAGWGPDRQGIIFAHGWLLKLESKLFVYGVSVGLLFSEAPFTVHRINIVETRL